MSSRISSGRTPQIVALQGITEPGDLGGEGERLPLRDVLRGAQAAYGRAGLEWLERLRPCHDLRVTSITNDALAGAHPVALMTKAGHANMATTKRYLKLDGAVSRTRRRR